MHSRAADNKKNDLLISKTLSWLLRHGAVKEKLPITSEGFISVPTLLEHRSLKSKCTIEDIKRVVENNDKQRFYLRTNSLGIVEIRANQGHSLTNILDLELIQILSPDECPDVIHGTYLIFWDSIKKIGLSRGKRTHIHFACGLPNDVNVVSGMRRNVEILIHIDLKKALLSGLKFYKSTNGVILSPGDEDGCIKSRYFLNVCRIDGSHLVF